MLLSKLFTLWAASPVSTEQVHAPTHVRASLSCQDRGDEKGGDKGKGKETGGKDEKGGEAGAKKEGPTKRHACPKATLAQA